MAPVTLEKVLEKLATTEKATLVVAKEMDGKMRVTSGSWEGEKVFLRAIRSSIATSTAGCTGTQF